MKPSSVRIIGKTYKVLYASGKPLDDDNLGELDHDKQRIHVRTGQPLEQEQDTLLHEVVHGIDHEMNLNMSEKQVRGLATGMLAVLKDNPRLLTYLRGKK